MWNFSLLFQEYNEWIKNIHKGYFYQVEILNKSTGIIVWMKYL